MSNIYFWLYIIMQIKAISCITRIIVSFKFQFEYEAYITNHKQVHSVIFPCFETATTELLPSIIMGFGFRKCAVWHWKQLRCILGVESTVVFSNLSPKS
jgi:hypothetical protein